MNNCSYVDSLFYIEWSDILSAWWITWEVYENLEFAHPNIGTNISYVDSEADAIFLHDKTIINLEFNNSFGEMTDIKNETYIVHLYLNQQTARRTWKSNLQNNSPVHALFFLIAPLR